jgi:hypothetical protein
MATLESRVDAAVEVLLDTDQVEAARRLLKAFGDWDKIRTYAKTERKRTKEEVDGRLQQFTEAMEVGHSNANDQILKLTVVEQRWQDLTEARDGRKLVLKALSDQLKGIEQKIRDLTAEAKDKQLSLFNGSSSTIDNPPEAEDDPEEEETEDPETEGLDVDA